MSEYTPRDTIALMTLMRDAGEEHDLGELYDAYAAYLQGHSRQDLLVHLVAAHGLLNTALEQLGTLTGKPVDKFLSAFGLDVENL